MGYNPYNTCVFMSWTKDYQLFLLDFDGLLVDTERVHYEAYRKMCRNRGFELDWTFSQYCDIAHYNSHGLEKVIYAQFPKLKEKSPEWGVLYQEKTAAYIDLIQLGMVNLMPGAKAFLEGLRDADVKRCLVTHSKKELVECIQEQYPVIKSLPNLLTREDYKEPKPSSECYLEAISRFANLGDQVVGFEDTPRGMKALMPTEAQAVIVTEMKYPEIKDFVAEGAIHFSSLADVPL